jgi:adenylate kinase
MMCGITGTPGTGKSMIGTELSRRGHTVVHLTTTVGPYVIGDDEERDAQIIDTDRWAAEFVPVDGFVEGHIAHLLPCDRIVVLRCRPDELKKRLMKRKYPKKKVRENMEAEALDVCLIETQSDLAEARLAASEADLKAGRIRRGTAADLMAELRKEV